MIRYDWVISYQSVNWYNMKHDDPWTQIASAMKDSLLTSEACTEDQYAHQHSKTGEYATMYETKKWLQREWSMSYFVW